MYLALDRETKEHTRTQTHTPENTPRCVDAGANPCTYNTTLVQTNTSARSVQTYAQAYTHTHTHTQIVYYFTQTHKRRHAYEQPP